MSDSVEKMISKTFLDIASALETGTLSPMPKIGVTGPGSEHGEDNVLQGALAAAERGIDVTYIGTLTNDNINTVHADCSDDAFSVMEKMLADGTLDGAVTMHYPFPIGVSTVGRVVVPGTGKNMYIATTTGTSSANRVESMVKNGVYGIIAAKACGLTRPTVGILNVDGARQTETALKKLVSGGYDLNFATSDRADGGSVMRGNDVLTGACDVLVTDSLTGNLLIKMLSAFTTGGNYESVGFGYGPGIGQGYDRLVMIVSRASGAPVIGGAIEYAAQLVRGDYRKVSADEFKLAEQAGLSGILEEIRSKTTAAPQAADAVKAPPKEVVTGQLSGIEIMDLEDAVACLWKADIYAESGMGCTGPIILVNEKNMAQAEQILKDNNFIDPE